MKASTFFAVIAVALSACDRESPPPTNATGVTGAPRAFESAALSRGVVVSDGKVGAADAAQFGGAFALASTVTADSSGPPSAPSGVDPMQSVGAGTTAPTMVIRTGQAFIEVDKVDPAVLKVRQLAAQVGGYITNSSISGGNDQMRQATLEIKIPAPKYDQAIGSLPAIGKVETVSSTAQDVGEEFVDVTARVNNSRRLEERLISLLANRTGKLEEVLRVERELASVREEIERYEGRLRYLSARIAMSTLTVTVHEPAPILGNSPGENPIAAALRLAWRNFIAVVSGSIAALGVAIPLALIGFATWAGYRRWKR